MKQMYNMELRLLASVADCITQRWLWWLCQRCPDIAAYNIQLLRSYFYL